MAALDPPPPAYAFDELNNHNNKTDQYLALLEANHAWNLITDWFLDLRGQVNLVLTKSSIGYWTYETLPSQLQCMYTVCGEQALKRQDNQVEDAQLFKWFAKLFATYDLLQMEGHGLLYQTFISPPSVDLVASEDLAIFYRKRTFDGKSWFAAKYIDDKDVVYLKAIQASTTRMLLKAWKLRLQ